ncbi:DUF2442 domain-containing protein [Paraburkholderia fungorum]|uniref:DUF2442 domain-containing protein n=2 Tax=Paraburkholderia fungorum TaxID=134537 RepID=UPI0038B6E9E4
MARNVNVDEDGFTVILMDGGKLVVPFQRFPRLFTASRDQRRAVRISASGSGLRWDQLDEDISVSELMRDAARRHRDERLG